ncbi:hypothetical protein GKA01_20540 [Gluconobacter kanchanaburiensis NBRC 103587]|uniref:Uncharacterized protein n=1 Tax=Gluconobacter kanchanaburiensis NBRC 103587 TaxID=1307948 RepID=A0A511BGC3_9PROT|nr:hypothetical protein [Gluconobacter kanchanaburiensis]GBR71858.1 hypothetical protein AA103587_2571 [Gluconobacter kanchanaburiensis NBRC 103587]GEK96857.1 hypothetical protein GKA01_20540 [Gluconobacter kanchanaburiensis NBRC 103587]
MMIVTERKGEAQSVLKLIKSTPGQVRKELSPENCPQTDAAATVPL